MSLPWAQWLLLKFWRANLFQYAPPSRQQVPYLESVIGGVISLPSSQDVLAWTLFLVFKETSQGKLPGLIPCVLFIFTGPYLGMVQYQCWPHG